MHKTYSLFPLVATLFSSLASASCIHGTSLMRREAPVNGKVKVSNFGYTGLQGPLNWAQLETGNFACATSKVQSPVNIDKTIPLAAEVPVINFPAVQSAEFENLGTTLEVIVNGTTTFAGKDFQLKQFHFHTPSEHRISEEYFPLEMHMVHEAAGKRLDLYAKAVGSNFTQTEPLLSLPLTLNFPSRAQPPNSSRKPSAMSAKSLRPAHSPRLAHSTLKF